MCRAVRTLVDPADAKDVEASTRLQDAIKVEQPGGPGSFETPHWDPASQKKVRDALLALALDLPDTKGMFGPKAHVDPVRQLIGSASAWGGNPEKDALYLNVYAGEERRHDDLQAQCQGRAGRRLLVDQRLQCQGLFRAELLTPTR